MRLMVTPSDVFDHTRVTALDLQGLHLCARLGQVPHAHSSIIGATEQASRGKRTPRKTVALGSVAQASVLGPTDGINRSRRVFRIVENENGRCWCLRGNRKLKERRKSRYNQPVLKINICIVLNIPCSGALLWRDLLLPRD